MSKARTYLHMCAGLAVLLSAYALSYADGIWNGQPYNLSLPSITSVGQSTQNSIVLPLSHDSPCSVTVSVLESGDEVLTSGSNTLVTSYRLTSPGISNSDADFLSSDDFLNRSYTLPGTGPLDSLTLSVRGAAAPAKAVDAGVYSATITLTVTW